MEIYHLINRPFPHHFRVVFHIVEKVNMLLIHKLTSKYLHIMTNIFIFKCAKNVVFLKETISNVKWR